MSPSDVLNSVNVIMLTTSQEMKYGKNKRLRDSLEQPVTDFVQKDSQQDRAAETRYEKQCIQENGIQRHPHPVFPIEEKLEVLKSDPFAPHIPSDSR